MRLRRNASLAAFLAFGAMLVTSKIYRKFLLRDRQAKSEDEKNEKEI